MSPRGTPAVGLGRRGLYLPTLSHVPSQGTSRLGGMVTLSHVTEVVLGYGCYTVRAYRLGGMSALALPETIGAVQVPITCFMPPR